jgi:hypothetical protein
VLPHRAEVVAVVLQTREDAGIVGEKHLIGVDDEQVIGALGGQGNGLAPIVAEAHPGAMNQLTGEAPE